MICFCPLWWNYLLLIGVQKCNIPFQQYFSIHPKNVTEKCSLWLPPSSAWSSKLHSWFFWPDTRNTFTIACILLGKIYSLEITSSNGPPKKRICLDSTRKCLINYMEETGDLTALDDAQSRKTRLRAAQIQQYQPSLDLVHKLEDDNIPVIYYHRKCHGIFTMKKDLDRFCKTAESKSCNPESLSKPGEEIKSILSSKDTMSWPPKQLELTVDAVQISDSVRAFLCTSLTGNTEPHKFCSQRVQCLANSFGQDLVFGVTNGWVKTPKHMLELPYAVKSWRIMWS